MTRKHKSNPQQGQLFETEPRVYERRGLFEATPPVDESMKVVRGALADALDRSFTDGPLGVVLFQADRFPDWVRVFVDELTEAARDNDRLAVVKLLRGWGLRVFQDVAVALFPEIYSGDPRAVGIAPAGGPERVGRPRVDAVAALGELFADVARSA